MYAWQALLHFFSIYLAAQPCKMKTIPTAMEKVEYFSVFVEGVFNRYSGPRYHH